MNVVLEAAANETRLTAAAEITARIERWPFSTWHIRLVSVVGIAHQAAENAARRK
jgi:hypothetical protein